MAQVAKLPKVTQKQWMIVVIFAFISFAIIQVIIHYSPLKPPQNSSSTIAKIAPTSTTVPEQAKPGIPLRLKIPTINLDAAVERLSLTPSGDLDAPKTSTSTGWYQDGVRPGEAGSAVIDGHYGWIRGKPSIFNDLNKLKKGDELYVEDDTGLSTRFIVRGSKLYAPAEDASAVFHSDDGKAYLNLITCQGVWENSQQSYSDRLVVFAEKQTSLPPD